tara:strand:- start:3061 stop:4269 length:1209 start_codon:yes stop_codon:yes gene_type:complete
MWKTVKLKEICTVFNDGDWIETKHQSEGGIRLIQTGNIKSGYFSDRIDKARYISEDTFASLNCTEIFSEDILVSRLPEPVGRACIIPALDERAITAVDCTIIRVQEEKVISEFLNYYMQSPSYFTSVQKELTGTTRQRISRKKLGEIPVILPPLAEQQRIVAKLDAAFAEIDAAIAAADSKETEVQKLKASLLSSSLSGDAVMWKTVKLGDICQFVRGPFGGNLKKSFFVESGFAVYEQKHAIENQCDDFRYFVTLEKFNEMSRFAVSAGDILMSCSGTIGKSTIVPKGAPTGIINQALLKITPSEVIEVRFLKLYMESRIFSEQLMDTVDGMAMQNVASVKTLKNITINLPPLAEQQRIVAKLDAAFANLGDAKDAVAKSKLNYQSLKSAILAQELQSEVA